MAERFNVTYKWAEVGKHYVLGEYIMYNLEHHNLFHAAKALEINKPV